MSAPAIKVQGLSKEYIIGRQQKGQETFREMIVAAVAAPFQRLRKMRGDVAQEERFWALKDINFEVQPGEVVGIIGRNGAGKSTLLKILSRITEPTSGEVQMRGRVSSLLEVGTGFHPELTGRENIFLNGAILGMSRRDIQGKFDEIVAFAEIEKFLDTPVKRYSSGMYMRLAFSVAAHLEPDVVLIDEVLAVGDAAFQKKCLAKMGEVARGGRTVLFVSHQLASVLNLCTTTMVIDRGQVRHVGPTKTVVNQYLAELGSNDAAGAIVRPGWAEPLIVSAQAGCNGARKSGFELGGTIEFEMTVALPPGRTVRDPVMGVVIRHPLFGIIGGINTRMAHYKIPNATASHLVLTCRIPELPLIQGSYSADLWFGDGLTDLDAALEAVRFDVHGTDPYSTGKLPIEDLGVVFLKADWGYRLAA